MQVGITEGEQNTINKHAIFHAFFCFLYFYRVGIIKKKTTQAKM